MHDRPKDSVTHATGLTARLEAIVEEFRDAPDDLRIELLLEYAESLPPLPADLDSSGMEQVVECQTPFFLHSSVADDRTVRIWFDCPPEAPTTRAFAGILADGLREATVDEVLRLPDDLAERMGLDHTISPLRLRGMRAIVFRLRRQARDHVGARQ